MNVLVIAPHPDDESIGCGGALRKHVLAGDVVSAVFLTSGELSLKHLPREKAWELREAEARNAAAVLGIAHTTFLRGPDWTLADRSDVLAEQLAPIFKAKSWSLVYLPHPGEWHPDHKASLPILRSVLARSTDSTPTLRGYEIWTPLPEFQHVEDITPVLRVKLRAIRAYQSQLAQFDYTRAAHGLSAYRGALAAHCRYAEVFQHLALGGS